MDAPSVGELNEGPLHAALKQWYRRPGDRVEQPLDGFVIDLVRDATLIEIQTGSFSAMRRKLDDLLDHHPMRIVHPIAAERHILKIDGSGSTVSRRRSPKRGTAADVCVELVSFPSLLSHPNFALEVVLTHEEEVRRRDPKKGWRRGGWVVVERRLLAVVEQLRFVAPRDLLSLLPAGIPQPFTTADLAKATGRSRRQAGQLAYCLKTAGVIEAGHRDRRGIHYRIGPRD